jgi:release factor glutamine methyltransferase
MTLSECLERLSDLPDLDRRIILKEVCNLSATDLIIHKDREISPSECETIFSYSDRRREGTPLAYILGHWGFRYNTFLTPEGVLVPRPDTEVLVESVLKCSFSKQSITILDMCAGTGCIGISTALELAEKYKNLNIELHLSDLSPVAFDTFSKNAESLIHCSRIKVFTHKGNLFEPIEKTIKFDLILTNPPYIPSSVIPTLGKAVLSEPILALDGGESGLEFIEKEINEMVPFLAQDGIVFMEIGYDQGVQVSSLFSAAGFASTQVIKDYGNNDRVVKASFK